MNNKTTIFLVLLFISTVITAQNQQKIDSLVNLASTMPDNTELVDTYEQITKLYLNTQLDSAKIYARKMIEIADQLEYGKGSVLGNNWLGEAYLRAGHIDSAIYFFRKTYDLNIKASNKLYAAYSLQTIASCYLQKSIYDSATYCYQTSLNILMEIGDEHGMASAYSNLALTYSTMGEYDLAIENVYEAIGINQKTNNQNGIVNGYNDLANIFMRMNVYDSAFFYYRKVIGNIDPEKSLLSLANIYNNMGVAYKALSSLDSSIYYYRMALNMRKKGNFYRGLGDSYMNMGTILNYWKKYDSALAYYQKSRAIFTDLNYDHGLAHNYFVTANLFDSIQQWDSALYYHTKCYDIAVSYHIPIYIRDGAFGMSHAYSMLNDDNKALNYYKIYKSYQDSLFNRESSERIGWVRAKFSFDKQLLREELKREQLWKFTLGISAALIVLLFLLWFINRQLNEKKRLIKKLIAKDRAIDCPRTKTTPDDDDKPTDQSKRQLPNKRTIDEIFVKLDEWEQRELFIKPEAGLESLRDFCNTNTNYLSHVFNQLMQVSFTEYLNGLRLKKSKKLLANPEKVRKLNVEGIGKESGFRNKGTFYKYFKQDMGITPKQFVNSLR